MYCRPIFRVDIGNPLANPFHLVSIDLNSLVSAFVVPEDHRVCNATSTEHKYKHRLTFCIEKTKFQEKQEIKH